MKEDKSNCVFCSILEGKSPVSIVYEDDLVIVFPTIAPVNTGHMLIVPKVHAPYSADLDEETTLHVIKIARKITAAIRKSGVKCEGINWFLADGEAAGQEVFHFHFHVYPRFTDDGFGFKYDKSKNFINPGRNELNDIADEIKKLL